MKLWGLAAFFALPLLFCAGIGGAQTDEETLADIRVQLDGLRGELLRLESELRTSGGPRAEQEGAARPVSENVLLRLDALEAELRENIGKIERLESRIKAILTHGSVQLRDLELRLVELEGGDVSQIDWSMTLGGAAAEQPLPSPNPVAPEIDPNDPELRERRSFQAAMATFESGNLAAAEAQFADFIDEFPESAYSGEAHFYRGESLFLQQQWESAARSFLDSYQNSVGGPLAPGAALRLAESLNWMGKRDEACQIFDLITEQYPGTDEANTAGLGMTTIGCN